MTKELTHNHDMQTYFPLDPNNLNMEQRTEGLVSLMFLVENKYGIIEAKSCSDGIKQRRRPGYKEEDDDSRTVSNEKGMITSMIESQEKFHVACIAIPGAYLHALTDEEEIMFLRGPLA